MEFVIKSIVYFIITYNLYAIYILYIGESYNMHVAYTYMGQTP